MMEDCATGMSTTHGCNGEKDLVDIFTDALKQRVGADVFRVWFGSGVTFEVSALSNEVDVHAESDERTQLVVSVRGQFALDRLRNNYLQSIRGAAMQTLGRPTDVKLTLTNVPATQIDLPLENVTEDEAQENESETNVGARPASSHQQRKRPAKKRTAAAVVDLKQPELPGITTDSVADLSAIADPSEAQTIDSFVVGDCNRLAFTAAVGVCKDPRSASPLFLSGPTGTGKSHLLAAIADQFRRRYRMRRVVHLSAETFTNDFVRSVGSSGLPAFRARYRDVDALLIDDVQFLGSKRATLREMLYTAETLMNARRPLIFSANAAPSDIAGLGTELAGRLSCGLMCPIQSLSGGVREAILERAIDSRCAYQWPEATVQEINSGLPGDARIIEGITNLVATLQSMFGRMPTMDEIRQYGGDLLRAARPTVTLSRIEKAVAEAFHLPTDTLRSQLKSRTATEPRMLAMYLSRELTSCAYAEIGKFYGGRSHSTAIVAKRKVQDWIEKGKSIGRGAGAMSAQDAIQRIEQILRAG